MKLTVQAKNRLTPIIPSIGETEAGGGRITMNLKPT